MSNRINVFIVDDHSVVRRGLKMFLELDKEIVICGEAGNLNEAVELISQKKPDLVLLDFKLPDGDGIIGCQKIKRMYPDIKIIILTAFANDDIILEATKAGADAYLLKDIESEQLISTIFSVSRGKNTLGSVVTVTENQRGKQLNLSNKEILILDMISLGKVNKEIADSLNMAEKTVRNNISRIFKKINVANRTEAASFWIRQRGL
ncbi:response regulator transcription factor [Bacillaceae bacterium IKA-2]|nr:response regulator transcription factor [Bacillaceae bacterium IKA-2]